jgi:uncharacterized protein (TIGR03435 family)
MSYRIIRSSVLAGLLAIRITLTAQSVPVPFFEVTSVKRYVNGTRTTNALSCGNGHFNGLTVPVSVIIAYAYDVTPAQISGLPVWATNRGDLYDVRGIGQFIGEHECKLAVQALLADRFSLTVKESSISEKVYTLHVDKRGLKIREVGADDDSMNGPGFFVNGQAMPMMRRELTGWTMEQLATALSLQRISGLDRRVIDRTNARGLYKIALHFSRDLNSDTGPDIRTALRQELGLVLDSDVASARQLTIVGIERPSGD